MQEKTIQVLLTNLEKKDKQALKEIYQAISLLFQALKENKNHWEQIDFLVEDSELLLRELQNFVRDMNQTVEDEEQCTTPSNILEKDVNSLKKNTSKQHLSPHFSSTIEDRYEVLHSLGEGGMGVVELVKDLVLKREIALKTVKFKSEYGANKNDLRSQMMIWRFRREAEIMAILEHPNIVPLYDFEETEEEEFRFTMRKVTGKTLRDLLIENKKRSKLPISKDTETEFLSIFLKVCDAVAYAHNKGIIHRDLKPENIMIGEFGEVYVMDWGIAKQTTQEESNEEEPFLQQSLTPKEKQSIDISSDATQQINEQNSLPIIKLRNSTLEEDFLKTRGGLGTHGYMSPEQTEKASQVTLKADIFSLGQILKEGYTLLNPIEEFKIILKDVSKAMKGSLPNSSEYFEKRAYQFVPKDMEAIIKKAKAKEEKERFNNVKEMVEEIRRYQRHEWVQARKDEGVIVVQLAILKKWFRRNQKSLSLFVLVLFLSFSIVFYFQWQRYQSFQNFFVKGTQEVLAANKLHHNSKAENSKAILEQKTQYFLNALNFFNKALTYRPRNYQVELKKKLIVEKLLSLSTKSKDYQLALYLAKEMSTISFLNATEQEKYITQVNIAKTKQLKQHKIRLDYWFENLKNPKPGMQGSALLEISKMPEQEIFELLQQKVKEGTSYYLANKNRSAKLDSYYRFMVEILGSVENPGAGDLLISSLTKIRTKIFEEHRIENAFAEIEYMVSLAQSLANCKVLKAAVVLDQIRHQMGIQSSFSKRTEQAYLKLGNLASLRFPTFPTASDFLNRGHYFFHLGEEHSLRALEDTNQAIKLNPELIEAYRNRAFLKRELNDVGGALKDINIFIKSHPNNAFGYFNRASIKEELKDLQGAIQDYSEAIRLNKKLSEAFRNRALVYLQIGKNKEALADSNNALLLAPWESQSYSNRGMVRIRRNDFSGAMKDLNKAIQLNSDSVVAYHNRGLLKSKTGQYQEALIDFNKTIALEPKHFKAFLNRGQSRAFLKDLQGALLDFDEAIQLKPDFAIAYCNRGIIKIRLKQYFEALKDLEHSLSLNPKDFLSIGYRGVAKFHLKQYLAALKDLDYAISLNNQEPTFYFARGQTQRMLNHVDKALNDLKKTIELSPGNPNPFLEIASIYSLKKEYNNALNFLEQVLQFAPKNVQAHFLIGLVKLDLRELHQALESFNTLLQLDPEMTHGYLNRAVVRYELQQFGKALEDIEKFFLLEKKEYKAFYIRGQIRTALQNRKGALEDFDQAIKMNPQFSEAYFNRAIIKIKKKNISSAMEDLKLAIQLQPNNIQFRAELAELKLNAKNLKGALQDYDQLIESQGKAEKIPLFYSNRSRVKFELRDLKGALDDANQAILLEETSKSIPNELRLKVVPKTELYQWRGFVKLIQNDNLGALNDLNEAILLNPKNENAYSYRAIIKKRMKDFKGALTDYDQTIQLNSEYADAYLNRGILFFEMQQKEKALNDFQKVIKLNPKEFKAYYYISYIKKETKDYIEMLKSIDSFFKVVPENHFSKKQQYSALAESSIFFFRQKEFFLAKESLILLKKYAPLNHPVHKNFTQYMQRIEVEIKKQRDK